MKNIALLIDADNSPSKYIQNILDELSNYGNINIRRAYGNWTSPNLNGWQAIIQDYAIQPIQQYDLTKGKNATDIALSIDAMDILYTKKIDVFCLASSDCDFTPLATRLLADGKLIIGFGQKKTPASFVNSCSKFIFLEEKDEFSDHIKFKINRKLIQLLSNAVTTTREQNGWSNLSRVGSLVSNHTSFDLKDYGCTRLSELIDNVDIFEIKREKNQIFVKKSIL
jgi:uncharacterized protein (TIGR00288 family)